MTYKNLIFLILVLHIPSAFSWQHVDIPSQPPQRENRCRALFVSSSERPTLKSQSDKNKTASEYRAWRQQLLTTPSWQRASEYAKIFNSIIANPKKAWLDSNSSKAEFSLNLVLRDFENDLFEYHNDSTNKDSSLLSSQSLVFLSYLARTELYRAFPKTAEARDIGELQGVFVNLFEALRAVHLSQFDPIQAQQVQIEKLYIKSAYQYFEAVRSVFKRSPYRDQLLGTLAALREELDTILDGQFEGKPLSLQSPLKEWLKSYQKILQIFNIKESEIQEFDQ